MKKVNVSTKQIAKFQGMWVAIDHKKEKIIAAGKTLKDIAQFVSAPLKDKNMPIASAFKVPKKNERYLIL